MLHDALLAPNSNLPVKAEGGVGVEFTTREVKDEIFILACKREGPTLQAKFTNLPTNLTTADVLYESPRTVEAKNGTLTDWFAPFDVHVYRFKK